MKLPRFLAALATIASLFSAPSWAAGSPVTGYYFVQINGYLRTPITATGSVTCTAYLYAVPTPGNLTVANIPALILANSATANASTTATIQPNKQNFSCGVTLPYYFNAFDSATQSLYLVYNVKLQDPVFVDVSTNPPTITPGSGIRSTKQTSPITVAPGGGQGLGPFTVTL